MSNRVQLTSTTRWFAWGKRPFDLLVAFPLTLSLAPILGAMVVLARALAWGPLFFRQERAGKDGKLFRTLKFRTMRAERKPDPKEIVPLDHSDITAVGRFLRRTKLDELPQLLNVLTGDMSLIGPRPTLPDQAAAYDDFRRQRLLVRPGMTGLAQVYSNSLVPWDERILYDLAYVRRCSFVLDLWILIRTIGVIFLGEKRMTRPFHSTRFAKFVSPPTGYGKS